MGVERGEGWAIGVLSTTHATDSQKKTEAILTKRLSPY